MNGKGKYTRKDLSVLSVLSSRSIFYNLHTAGLLTRSICCAFPVRRGLDQWHS